MSNKLLVIGLDGASFNVLDPLIEKGYLPNIASLIAGGTRADLTTTFPPITAVAWSSFMTGKNPGKHGIFEFVRRDHHSNRELAVNASFRQGRAIWDLLGDAGKRVFAGVGKPAWQRWLAHQTMLINENRLSPLNPEHRALLEGEMLKFLFGGGADKPAGYVPEEA